MTKTNGWAWIHENQRPIISARVIERGKDKGKVEVETVRRKETISKDDIITWPEND